MQSELEDNHGLNLLLIVVPHTAATNKSTGGNVADTKLNSIAHVICNHNKSLQGHAGSIGVVSLFLVIPFRLFLTGPF